MACVMCERCDRLIDIDYNAEAYRQELNDRVICDGCFDGMAESGELVDALRKIQGDRPFSKEQQELIDAWAAEDRGEE